MGLTPYARPGLSGQDMGPVLTAYLDTVKTKVLDSLNGPGIARVRRPEPDMATATAMKEEQQQPLASEQAAS